MNAFLYLSFTSAKNRIWFQVRRLRNPRYIAALVLAGVYLWGFLVRPTNTGFGAMLLTQPGEVVATLFIAINLASTWIFGSDRLALAFTQAELSMLFPAPLSRRALIGYKLYRAQIAVLINALIWVFVLRRGGTALPGPMRAIGIWLLFSTLNLHRLGAALVRASTREHGTAGVKRNAVSIAFFVVVAALVAAGLIEQRDKLSAISGLGDFFTTIGAVLSTGPASIGLLPFRYIVAPAFTRSVSAWFVALGPALIILALHLFWVLRTDAAFEDAAIEASATRSRRLEAFRNRRGWSSPKPKAATSTIALASGGHPAVAIFWKNMLCLRRTIQWPLFIAPLAMSIAGGMAASEGFSDVPVFIATTCLAFCASMLVFGGRMIRNDLRHDMANLPLLKSIPLGARDLIVAEVASSALPMAALQLTLVIVAFFASLGSNRVPMDMNVREAIVAASPFAVLALNGALQTIQNGLAVLFPAWMRLGSTVNTGVEMLGQNLMVTIANLFSLALALVVPVLIAFVGVRYLFLTGVLAIAATIIFASAVLALETFGVIHLISSSFAKAEPLQQ